MPRRVRSPDGTALEGAVAAQSSPGVAGQQADEIDTEEHFIDQRRGVVSFWLCLCRGTARRGQTAFHRVELAGGQPRGQPAADGQLRVVEVHDEGRHVRKLWRHESMGVSEGENGLGQVAGGIMEDVGAECGAEVEIPVCLQAPRDGSAVRHARFADHPLLQVAEVTPVGVEVPRRSVCQRSGGGPSTGGARVGVATEDAHPTRRARCHPERRARGGQHRAALVEGIPVVVAPLAHGDSRGERGDKVGLARDHVSPHQHLAAGELGEPAQCRHPGQEVVQAARGKFPRLVEAHVDPAAGEERQQLGQQLPHEREGARIGRVDGHGRPRDAEGVDEAVGSEGERPVAGVAQPAVHVAQAVLVRHELDVPGAAEGIELTDLLRVERARLSVNIKVVAVGEGVLGIQLHLVHLERGQSVDHVLQGVHGRDLVAGDVEHDATDRNIRMVAHDARRQRPAVQTRQLAQRRLSIEDPGVVGPRQLHAGSAYVQLVTLCGQGPVDLAPRRSVGDDLAGQFHEPGYGEQVHASSLR